ncbi:MAG: aminomethyltransferase family protein [Hyphomicrobiales bacterium]
MTEELSRTSALASRHTELGSGLEDWNGMGTAWSYSTDPNDEHNAVRERAGMFDMSPLKKIMVSGADATAVVNSLVTRDVNHIGTGRAAYVCVLTDEGTIADDAIIYNNGGDNWMIVHGSGDTMALLETSASGKNVIAKFDDDLHDLSVQGPQSLEVLDANCSADLAKLAYFEHTKTDLFGHPCRISRTGYSGERGYEVFAGPDAICEIWDKLVEAGVMPCSFTTLDKVRIEAGLLFYGYDMTTDNTPWEVGLGFTVNSSKEGYRGQSAVVAARGSEKVKNICLVIDHPDMVEGGEELHLNGENVGIINSPCYSHRLGKSLALAHVHPSAAAAGTKLNVSSDAVTTTAEVISMPIYDPSKSRTHAE